MGEEWYGVTRAKDGFEGSQTGVGKLSGVNSSR